MGGGRSNSLSHPKINAAHLCSIWHRQSSAGRVLYIEGFRNIGLFYRCKRPFYLRGMKYGLSQLWNEQSELCIGFFASFRLYLLNRRSSHDRLGFPRLLPFVDLICKAFQLCLGLLRSRFPAPYGPFLCTRELIRTGSNLCCTLVKVKRWCRYNFDFPF